MAEDRGGNRYYPEKFRNKAREKIERLVSVPDKFSNDLKSLQDYIWDKVLEKLLIKLELKNGNIIDSTDNFALVAEVVAALEKQFKGNGAYEKYLSEFSKEFNAQRSLTHDLLTGVFDAKANRFNEYFDFAKNQALNSFAKPSINAAYIKPLQDAIGQQIATGAGFKDTLDLLKVLAHGGVNEQGATVDGKLYAYAKTEARTAFSKVDRGYSDKIATDLGLEFYYYDGPVVEDSRPFCVERDGKFYHKKEIEAWGKGKKCCGLHWPQNDTWAGRIPGTDSASIFTNLGGYNCLHSLMPVSEAVVPENVVERARAAGYIK